MTRRDHPLFQRYPLNGIATTSTGEVRTPYHVYDGYGVFIGGTVDLNATKDLLNRESIALVQSRDGRTWMGIWICDFTDASLGPHHELQFSFFTAGQASPITPHPLALLDLMTRPDVRMLCHGLWNSSPTVVAYNRELQSLNARLGNSRVDQRSGTLKFEAQDAESRRPICSGTFRKLHQISWRANWDAAAKLGFRRTLMLARQPWISLQILNPTGIVLAGNSVAQSFTKNDVTLVRYYDPSNDALVFGDTPYAGLDFKPQFIQYMKGFKFVYLQPEGVSDLLRDRPPLVTRYA